MRREKRRWRACRRSSSTSRARAELQIKTGYLGMAMTYVDKRQVIPYINSFDGFEYRMASAANRMLGEDKKTVAFLTGHGEQGPTTGYRTFAGLLLDSYRVVELDTTEDPNIDLSEVDVLIIAGPNRSISDETTDAIRQYLLGGGKAMILIDTVEIDQGRLVATRNRNSFARLPEEFGVVVEEDLALDIESNETLSFSTQVGNVFLPYPFWVRAPVVDRKVSGNIESALLPWASSLGISESVHGRIETVNLLRTTPGAATISSSDASYGDVRPNAPIFNEVAAGERIRFEADMAVAVEQREAAGGQDAFRLVVFGDSEWLSDGILGRAQENVALGLNLVDWLAQEDTLAAVRSKVVSSRDLIFTSETHENIARWANIAGVPLLIVIVGLARSFRRRRFGFTRYGQAGVGGRRRGFIRIGRFGRRGESGGGSGQEGDE